MELEFSTWEMPQVDDNSQHLESSCYVSVCVCLHIHCDFLRVLMDQGTFEKISTLG